jgi:hypothetical protein
MLEQIIGSQIALLDKFDKKKNSCPLLPRNKIFATVATIQNWFFASLYAFC